MGHGKDGRSQVGVVLGCPGKEPKNSCLDESKPKKYKGLKLSKVLGHLSISAEQIRQKELY